MRSPEAPPPWARSRREGESPLPGESPILLAAVTLGFILLGSQLWLLTIALDLYLAGEGGSIWLLVLVSGLIALGGLAILALLRRRPRVRFLTTDESGRIVRHDDVP